MFSGRCFGQTPLPFRQISSRPGLGWTDYVMIWGVFDMKTVQSWGVDKQPICWNCDYDTIKQTQLYFLDKKD